MRMLHQLLDPLHIATIFFVAFTSTVFASYTPSLEVDGIDIQCLYVNCSGHGTCSLGICTCLKGWKTTLDGGDCEIENNCAGVTCSGKGICSERSLNWPAIKAANGNPKAHCECDTSQITGTSCERERSPGQAVIRYEGSLVQYENQGPFMAKGGLLYPVADNNCYMAKHYNPKSISKDEYLQFELAGENRQTEVIECYERKMDGDNVIILQAGIGSHPDTTNTAFSSSFDCIDVRQGGTAFDDAFTETPDQIGWCGTTAIGDSYTLLSTAGNYNDDASTGKSNQGPNIATLVYGMVDEAYEVLGTKILALRKIALGGKLIFQVSWPVGGQDYPDDPTNNANQDNALIWKKWSAFMNLDKDEILFTGNDQFNEYEGSGETSEMGIDPQDHTLVDDSQTARLFAKPEKLAMKRTEFPTLSPTISPTTIEMRQYANHTCRSGFVYGSDKNHCGNSKNPNFDCSCDMDNCWRPTSLYKCCVDVSSVCGTN